MTITQERRQLRNALKLKRAQLTAQQQRHASNQICHRLQSSNLFLNSQRLAFYLAYKGEVTTDSLLTRALDMGKTCYLPILHPIKHNQMLFGQYRKGDRLNENFLGILEPDLTTTQLISSRSLDLIITPLVAFDNKGNRLGMGAGFYDRTFAFKKLSSRSKPHLIGLAYQFQLTPNIQPESWDVALTAVYTEQHIYSFKATTRPSTKVREEKSSLLC